MSASGRRGTKTNTDQGGLEQSGVTPSQSPRRTLLALLTLGALVWIAAPVAGLAWISIQNQNAVFVEEEPAWVPVQEATEIVSQTVDLGFAWRQPDELLAPAWAGTVQQVFIKQGDQMSSGTPVVQIDGVTRLAWNTPGVFYRPLGRGDVGEDVVWLKSILSARGFAQTQTTAVDAAALRGLRGLADSLGVRDSARVVAFDPAWLVYLPREPLDVAELSITAAAPAPAAGTPIATSALTLDGAALLQQGLATDPQQESESAPTPSDLERLIASGGVAARAGEELRYAGEVLVLDETRQRLDAESVATLSTQVPSGSTGLIVQLNEEPQGTWWYVPAAALSLSGRSSLCVGRGDGHRNVQVTVIATGSAGTIVDGRIEQSDRVRVPAESTAAPCQ